jgi:pimeloyl-ACP methyl ester carboxylesterase
MAVRHGAGSNGFGSAAVLRDGAPGFGRDRMKIARLFAWLVMLAAPSPAWNQALPAAIATDPTPDKAHPARMEVLHIPSGGVNVNGIAYVPTGAGPHPILILFHGLPGNERNLDLAQAVRRAGWTVVAPNYRGSWGSPGDFTFQHTLDDGEAVLAWVKAHAREIAGDAGRIVLAGHSLGGWVTAQTAAKHPELAGAVLISAADMGGQFANTPRKDVVAEMADGMETLSSTNPERMADELITKGKVWSFPPLAPGLARVPLLVLTSDDGGTPAAEALVAGIRNTPGTRVATQHGATDHGWSDHRIALEAAVIDWLAALR